MKAPSTPNVPAPDPMATAKAQGAMNKETAIAQAGMNMVNQYTPEGNLQYVQTSNWSDNTPQYSVYQTDSPQNAVLRQQGRDFDQKFNQIGLQQTDKVGGLLSSPLKLQDQTNEATEARLADLGRKRLDPQFAEQQSALDQRLANQGIGIGSAAYNTAQRQQREGQNDAYNQLYLTGRGQANAELVQANQNRLTEREQPINEITGLMNGAQIGQPNWVQAPQENIASPDYMGMVQSNYAAQLQAAQQQAAMKAQSQNAMMGGLGGIGGSLLGGWAKGGFSSDRRLKTGIRMIGLGRRGLPLYRYRYIDQPSAEFEGYLADEVAAKFPKAVRLGADGFLRVRADFAPRLVQADGLIKGSRNGR